MDMEKGGSGPLLDYLVIDSAAFIKRASLRGLAKEYVTTPSVVAEIRDNATKAFIKSLPINLKFQEPDKEDLTFVTNLSKKTGDFIGLSKTDTELIALTYHFYQTVHGTSPKVREIKLTKKRPEFDESTDQETVPDEEEPSDDEAGFDWISSDNFEEKAAKNFGIKDFVMPKTCALDSADAPKVACMTTDYSMQNVLLMCGLGILGVDGMVIKQPMNRVLYCICCFKISKEKDVNFCPTCGNPSLRRIPATTHEDGTVELHFNPSYKPILKGTRQPIKAPEGGKHANNPIYCKDQRIPEHRLPKPKNKVQLIATNGCLGFDDEETMLDELARSGLGLDDDSGFGFAINDICSKATTLGLQSLKDHPNSRWSSGGFHGLRATKGKAHIPKPRHKRK